MLPLRQKLACQIVKVLQGRSAREARTLGHSLTWGSSVLNPRLFITSEMMARHLDVRDGAHVLDLGTGSGLQALVAARNAARVVAVDINPEAVASTRANCESNNIRNVQVLEGDLFAPLDPGTRFDLIIFTPPYMEGPIRADFDHALYDPGKALLRSFFEEAPHFLTPRGYVQMLYSSIAGHREALHVAKQAGFFHRVVAKQRSWLETFYVYQLWLTR